MVCYYCGHTTDVTNSRLQKRSNRVWRRRACRECKTTVTTLETLDYTTSLALRQPTGRLEPFSRDNLFLSVWESLRHRKTALRDATTLTENILAKLPECMNNNAIERARLVTLVGLVLQRFDPVAGTHYTAYHKS